MSPPALPRYVELIRVSTKDQAERDTPEDQRRALDALRTSRPGVLVTRIETAISGAKAIAERPDLLELEELAASGGFDELRVRHFDRLTRSPDPDEQDRVSRMLRKARAVVVEADGTITDPRTLAGRVITMIKQEGAAEERRRIWERTFGGRKRKAGEGCLAQGQPPFGRTYDKTTGEWGIHPERADIYRRMVELCLGGTSLLGIADALNREGRLTVRGLPWTDASICKLLHDPAMYGTYSTHGYTFHIPPIVDEATYHLVRAKLRSNNSLSGPRPKVFSLLRKKIICDYCGEPMWIQRGGGTPANFLYYRCSARSASCGGYHRLDVVDAAAMDTLRAALNDPEIIAKATALDAPKNAREIILREIAAAERELLDLDKQKEKLQRLYRKGLADERDLEKQMREVQRDLADVRTNLAVAKQRLVEAERATELSEGLIAAINELRASMESASQDQWRKLVELLFDRDGVRLGPNGTLRLVGRIPVGEPLSALGTR
jgi:DNA invertase Pin-like site-specific DNA recombinase